MREGSGVEREKGTVADRADSRRAGGRGRGGRQTDTLSDRKQGPGHSQAVEDSDSSRQSRRLGQAPSGPRRLGPDARGQRRAALALPPRGMQSSKRIPLLLGWRPWSRHPSICCSRRVAIAASQARPRFTRAMVMPASRRQADGPGGCFVTRRIHSWWPPVPGLPISAALLGLVGQGYCATRRVQWA